jgi:hypothetical protein
MKLKKEQRKKWSPRYDEEMAGESEIFPDAEEERMEIAPADLLEKERLDLLEKEYGKKC